MNGRGVVPEKRFRAPSIRCPVCEMTSFNVNDIREGYCGNCHDWTSRATWTEDNRGQD